MQKSLAFVLSGALALAAPLLVPSVARADLSACGDIHVEASAECELIAEGGCDVECQDLSFEAACHAEGSASCDGQCSASASASCEGSCSVDDCVAGCDVDPGEFDCQANCSLNCSADCEGSCEGKCGTGDSECRGECEGSCKASCEGSCEGSCTGTPPSASCEAKCSASCEGRCEAEANAECQVDCQANLQAACEANLQGGCTAQCQSPEGAVKCDGEYVDHNGNAQACLDALTAWTAAIDASASGHAMAECSNGKCEANAEGKAEASCALGHAPSSGAAYYLLALGAAVAGLRRRRR